MRMSMSFIYIYFQCQKLTLTTDSPLARFVYLLARMFDMAEGAWRIGIALASQATVVKVERPKNEL